MASKETRRRFMKETLLASTALGMTLGAQAPRAAGEETKAPAPAASDGALPKGKLGELSISRILLGGNLLTHYTHSRDLQYVYSLAAHYNTDAKICETLALAEQNGVNTLVVHTVPHVLDLLRKYRRETGAKMQWIICPTAPPDKEWDTYCAQVRDLVDNGTEAVYLWGVTADRLVAEGKMDIAAKAVAFAKEAGVPSGVGAHDLRVIAECEKQKIPADFYIKTFHHLRYPSAPRPEQVTGAYNETPAYWCANADEVVAVMNAVEKPWFAFKVMAAGAIPPQDAFTFAFNSGADHVLAGMFDYEIAEDVSIAKDVLAKVSRTRPWRS